MNPSPILNEYLESHPGIKNKTGLSSGAWFFITVAFLSMTGALSYLRRVGQRGQHRNVQVLSRYNPRHRVPTIDGNNQVDSIELTNLLAFP
jgi:hypothetical protein